MDNLKNYLESCKNGNIANINPEIFHEIDRSNKYYVNQGLLLAYKLDHTHVVSYIFQQLRVGFRNYMEELLEENTKEEKADYAQKRMFSYVLEFFRENLADVCKGSVDIFKLITQELNGIPNSSDFGNCLRESSAAGNLPLIKHLVSTPEHAVFIEQWKYYNNYLDTKNEATDIIKYFVETPELAPHIKSLQLFQSAYQSNNQELIEYLIFDCKMLYSKKTRKAVQGMTDGLCNVPHLFENRDKILLAQKLGEDLADKAASKPKVKI